MSEEHTPYYSVRVRVGDITSPKDLVGTKEFTCEVTLGNTPAIIIRDRNDVAKIENKKLFDIIEEKFVERDEWAKKRKFTFVDQLPKQPKEPKA